MLLVGLAVIAASLFVGYKFGARGKAKAVQYEQELKEIYGKAYAKIKANLQAVKAEVAKLESEAKAEEAAAVARLKKLL